MKVPKYQNTLLCEACEREILLLHSGLFWFSAVDEVFFFLEKEWDKLRYVTQMTDDELWNMWSLLERKLFCFFFTAFSDQMAHKCLGHFAFIAINFAFNVTVGDMVTSNVPFRCVCLASLFQSGKSGFNTGQSVSFQWLCVSRVSVTPPAIRNPASIFARCWSTT